MKKGFTLAEVLITLGIVGVVSALTLPTLINNFRAKALETSFKKADAVLTRAMQTTMFEHGITRYYDFGQYCKGNYCTDTKASDYADLQDTWREQFDIVNDVDLQYIRSRKYKAFGFFGEAKSLYTGYASYFIGWGGQGKGFLLKDGMLIGTISFWPNNASEIGSTYHKWTIIPNVFFDTNGPAKGPNRFGYDLFYFINMTCHFTSCDPLSDSLGGCYLNARKDQNPYDSSVSYWKSLYKPKSYWEKLKNK